MSADPARNRWLVLVLVRIVASAGAVLGLMLLTRAAEWPPKLLGVAIVLCALYVMAVVPRALAHRWRTPPKP
ncbi:putative membrane-bound spermidine synthase [Sphingomonas sp. JUb134]|nr:MULTISPECIES: hypothetical protein [unclassified Sphingomonas]MBM7407332.1 putative membrane-bound spermidine synthase [Sphingomonas sp. JUb134]MCG7347461.1 hypothetical protein [Sphingomonas sp. ACRSK]